jgi:predicted metal-dependent hydrolase
MHKNFIPMFIIIFLVLCSYMYIENLNNEVTIVKSNIDGKEYIVRNVDDKQDAADLLSKMSININKLFELLKEKYESEPVKRLIKKYDPTNITESSASSKYTSYSVNKGEKIVLCIRSRDEESKLIDLNTLMFVSLHELAHIMTLSVGHTEEFWTNFKFLLTKGIELEIYKEIDYSKNPQKYCGITITDSPLYN